MYGDMFFVERKTIANYLTMFNRPDLARLEYDLIRAGATYQEGRLSFDNEWLLCEAGYHWGEDFILVYQVEMDTPPEDLLSNRILTLCEGHSYLVSTGKFITVIKPSNNWKVASVNTLIDGGNMYVEYLLHPVD